MRTALPIWHPGVHAEFDEGLYYFLASVQRSSTSASETIEAALHT